MKWLVMIAVLLGASEARAELWMSRLGELMKDATSIEVIDVQTMDAQTGVAEAVMFETWRSKRAAGERITERFGALAGLVKTGDRVLVICDAGECPRAVGVERDGWYTLSAQEPMDGAFVVPNVMSHLAMPALVAGKPAKALCIAGSVAFLDDHAAYPIRASASATDGHFTGGTNLKAGSVGGADFGSRNAPGVVVQVGNAFLRSRDAQLHPDCASGVYEPQQPGPRTAKELAAAMAGKPTKSVFARGTYRGKPIELAIDGEQIALVGSGAPEVTNLGGPTTSFGYAGKLVIEWPVKGDTSVVDALAKAKSLIVKVGATNVTLTYVPAK